MAKNKKKSNKKKGGYSIHGDVKRGAVAVFLFALSVLFTLGFLGQGAVLGGFLNNLAGSLFGWGKWISPLILIATGIVLLFRRENFFYISKIFGIMLIFLATLGFFHIFFDSEKFIEIAKAGEGGGYLGYLTALVLVKLTGMIGGIVILISLFIIGGIVAFNFSLVNFIRKFIRRKVKEFESNEDKDVSENDEEEKQEGEENDAEEDFEEDIEEETEDIDTENFEENQEEEKSSILERTSDMFRKKRTATYDWELPPLNILQSSSGKPQSGDIKAKQKIIKDTLASFGINMEPGDIKVGPTVSQYSFKPEVGVKLSRIVSLSDNLALALAAHTIRIEAPIPGKSMVGIEVPNKTAATVRMRDILKTKEFQENESSLSLAIGKDVNGDYIYADLRKMPHLMIAGKTGSGKSVCINSILLSLLYKNSPEDLKLILIDPKRVELPPYNNIPHLLSNVIVENSKVVNSLKWAIGEMERRYKLLQSASSQSIITFNEKAERKETYTYTDQETGEVIEEEMEKIPYIVIVVDELAEIMQSRYSKDVESAIIRIAQLGRAAGIHLVLSTQKPIVTVITSLIKSNISSRIAFKVPSNMDSRTILDASGAEKLLGNGDMLFSTDNFLKRIQGVFVSEKEISETVAFLLKQKKKRIEDEGEDLEDDITEEGHSSSNPDNKPGEEKLDFGEMEFEEDDEKDEYFEQAKEIVIQKRKASTTLLQRKLRVGYARAASLVDALEEEGIVGPANGSKPREVLVAEKGEGVKYDDDIDDQQQRDKWQM